jgi:glycerol-3-phosphate acyltransferase PlsX
LKTLAVAIDVMGGDHGTVVTLPAAMEALKKHSNLFLYLVGISDQIEPFVSLLPEELQERCKRVAATQVVEMDEVPTVALRTKKASSMRLALELVKSGEAQACVSAGNTGALMVMGRYVLKMLPGVDRPAIMYALPCDDDNGLPSKVRVLDLGANVDCDPEHLHQFAVMGSAFSKAVDNLANPRVALLNIGSEVMKGNETVKRAGELLSQQQGLNYIGYVEGTQMYRGAADVVVCDGFVGNIALKASEGVARLILDSLKREFNRNFYTKLIGFLAKPMFKKLKQRLDPNEHNGGTLLGLNGVLIKSHGGAQIPGFVCAIEEAMRVAEQQVPALISKDLEKLLYEE